MGLEIARKGEKREEGSGKMRGSKDRPESDPKKESRTRIVVYVVVGLVLVGMVYFAMFGGLKEMSFFGASTENTQALW